jgi:hypothetical protein
MALNRVRSMRARHALLLGWAWAAAAAAADEVVETYKDPTFHATVSNILVVGLHSDTNVRGMFENSVLRALRAAGATGDSSLARMGSTQEVTADTVAAAARRAGTDAVLITRVVDAEAQQSGAPTFVEYFNAYAPAQDPLGVTSTRPVRVTSDLYVVASQTRVWGAESTGFEKQNLLAAIDGIAKAVTAQLRTDGLIR